MTENPADRWARVATLLDAVLEREPKDRSAFLSEVCGGDESLITEVEDLLAAASEASFLDSGALAVAAPLLEPTEFTRENAPRGLPYELERQLGRGGTASVYLARDVKHHRRVAIKVLDGDLTAYVGVQRFVQEIRLTARLQHPHVLALLDSGVFGPDAGVFRERPYYVMPYVEGESLRARLARADAFGIGERLRVLREVADALRYAHEQGVVHRDIKPENILFSRDHAIVADFGIAKALVASQSLEDPEHNADSSSDGLLTQLSSLIGTPAYMAPEQAAGDASLDHRADLYAWGVVAYELLAGRHPFASEMSARELTAAHMRKTPEPLRDIAPAVPPEIAAVVMRCMAKAPADRPSSAAEVVDVLDSAAIDANADTGRAANSMRASATPRPTVATRKGESRKFLVAELVGFVPNLFGFVVIVVLAVSAVLFAREHASRPTAPKTVAVLPCRSLSSSQDDGYFSDGVTEELIASLGRFKPLEVAARASSFTFKNKNLSAREIGQQLHVGALVECTVSRSGDSVRVTAGLVDAADGHKIWFFDYDRNVRELFAVEDEISRAIGSALEVQAEPGSDRLSLHAATTSDEAYELYLRGRHFFGLRADETTLRKSVAYFDSATRVDSSYAAAYSGLSAAYSVLSIWGFEPPLKGFPVAKRAAQRALFLDNTLAEAHTSLGIISMWFDLDGETARRELTRAITLDSRYPAAHLFYAWFLASHDSTAAAVEEARIARELDPLSIIANVRVGTMLFLAGRYEQALAELQSSLALDSTNAMTHAELARVFMQLDRCSDALAEIRQLPASFQNVERGVDGFAYAVCGRRRDAEAMLKDLVNQWQHKFVFASRIASLEVGLGRHNQALAWLDSAIAQRDPMSHELAIEPLYRPLHSDPRFRLLLAKAGLRR